MFGKYKHFGKRLISLAVLVLYPDVCYCSAGGKKKNTYGCWEVGWVIHCGLNCRLLQDGRASVFLLFEPMVQQGARISLWSLGASTANAAARCEA